MKELKIEGLRDKEKKKGGLKWKEGSGVIGFYRKKKGRKRRKGKKQKRMGRKKKKEKLWRKEIFRFSKEKNLD